MTQCCRAGPSSFIIHHRHFPKWPDCIHATSCISAGTDRRSGNSAFQGEFAVQRELTAKDGNSCRRTSPRNLGQLWQPRLNIAWLPTESVFFRVVQLPPSTFAETLAMVELQLEKLSPLPVGQMLWGLYVLPRRRTRPRTICRPSWSCSSNARSWKNSWARWKPGAISRIA